MIIKTEKSRLRIGLCHQDGRNPIAATDISHCCSRLEFGLDTIERGNPFVHQVRGIAWAKKSLGALVQIAIMLMPAHSIAGLKCLTNFRFIQHRRGDDLVSSGNKCRTVLHRQRQSLFVRQREFARLWVEGDVTPGRLGREPFPDIALGGSRLLSQLPRCHRAGPGHRLV